jgi:hypothetical protein
VQLGSGKRLREIATHLSGARNDKRERARNDKRERARNDKREVAQNGTALCLYSWQKLQ